MKKVTAIIERGKDGYGVYSDDLPGVTGYGATPFIAKMDFEDAVGELLEGPEPAEFLNNGELDIEFIEP